MHPKLPLKFSLVHVTTFTYSLAERPVYYDASYLTVSQHDCTFHFEGSSKCDRGIHLNTSYIMSNLYPAFWLVISGRLCLSADYLTLVQILHDIHPVNAWLTSQESVFEPHLVNLTDYSQLENPELYRESSSSIFFSRADVFLLIFHTSLILICCLMF